MVEIKLGGLDSSGGRGTRTKTILHAIVSWYFIVMIIIIISKATAAPALLSLGSFFCSNNKSFAVFFLSCSVIFIVQFSSVFFLFFWNRCRIIFKY